MNSRSRMTLKSSVVIFQGLRSLCSLIDLSSLCNLIGLTSLYRPISSKKFLILMVWSSLAPKWPIPVPFCGMDHQKSNFSLISDTLSVRGCWGQPMLLFWKLVGETQMPHTQDIRTTFIQILACIFLSVRLNSKRTFQYETPCNRDGSYVNKMRGLVGPKDAYFFPHSGLKLTAPVSTGPEPRALYLLAKPRNKK